MASVFLLSSESWLVVRFLSWSTLISSRRVDIAAAWPLLSALHQEAIALAVLDGLTAPEAAAVLGISSTAFRLRLSRARRTLRRHVDSTAAGDRLPGHLASDRSPR